MFLPSRDRSWHTNSAGLLVCLSLCLLCGDWPVKLCLGTVGRRTWLLPETSQDVRSGWRNLFRVILQGTGLQMDQQVWHTGLSGTFYFLWFQTIPLADRRWSFHACPCCQVTWAHLDLCWNLWTFYYHMAWLWGPKHWSSLCCVCLPSVVSAIPLLCLLSLCCVWYPSVVSVFCSPKLSFTLVCVIFFLSLCYEYPKHGQLVTEGHLAHWVLLHKNTVMDMSLGGPRFPGTHLVWDPVHTVVRKWAFSFKSSGWTISQSG